MTFIINEHGEKLNTLATESHRPLSSFSEAVQEWNRRLIKDGWRSAFAPHLACPACKAEGIMLTTIYGTTRGACSGCEHVWELA
jgi:hypothetical protein